MCIETCFSSQVHVPLDLCCLRITSPSPIQAQEVFLSSVARAYLKRRLPFVLLKGMLEAFYTTLQAVESRNEEAISRLIRRGLSVAETESARKTLVSTSLLSLVSKLHKIKIITA